MKQIRCNRCGKPVSQLIPDNIIIRAWVECLECAEQIRSSFNEDMKKLAHEYFYEEKHNEKITINFGTIEAINLMVIALSNLGFEKGISQYKNFIEE
uniref:Uncharacterized protein n=1 Tax=viral metagenome TaxID=1070528 RepID=A0A6M3ILW7_9ZZZZ